MKENRIEKLKIWSNEGKSTVECVPTFKEAKHSRRKSRRGRNKKGPATSGPKLAKFSANSFNHLTAAPELIRVAESPRK